MLTVTPPNLMLSPSADGDGTATAQRCLMAFLPNTRGVQKIQHTGSLGAGGVEPSLGLNSRVLLVAMETTGPHRAGQSGSLEMIEPEWVDVKSVFAEGAKGDLGLRSAGLSWSENALGAQSC